MLSLPTTRISTTDIEAYPSGCVLWRGRDRGGDHDQVRRDPGQCHECTGGRAGRRGWRGVRALSGMAAPVDPRAPLGGCPKASPPVLPWRLGRRPQREPCGVGSDQLAMVGGGKGLCAASGSCGPRLFSQSRLHLLYSEDCFDTSIIIAGGFLAGSRWFVVAGS